MTDVPDEVQRWTAKRKAAVVMSIVKGETSAAEAARKHGLTVAEIERWQEQFFAAGENALRAGLLVHEPDLATLLAGSRPFVVALPRDSEAPRSEGDVPIRTTFQSTTGQHPTVNRGRVCQI